MENIEYTAKLINDSFLLLKPVMSFIKSSKVNAVKYQQSLSEIKSVLLNEVSFSPDEEKIENETSVRQPEPRNR